MRNWAADCWSTLYSFFGFTFQVQFQSDSNQAKQMPQILCRNVKGHVAQASHYSGFIRIEYMMRMMHMLIQSVNQYFSSVYTTAESRWSATQPSIQLTGTGRLLYILTHWENTLYCMLLKCSLLSSNRKKISPLIKQCITDAPHAVVPKHRDWQEGVPGTDLLHRGGFHPHTQSHLFGINKGQAGYSELQWQLRALIMTRAAADFSHWL